MFVFCPPPKARATVWPVPCASTRVAFDRLVACPRFFFTIFFFNLNCAFAIPAKVDKVSRSPDLSSFLGLCLGHTLRQRVVT
jgi:hypothetical protein